MKRTLYGICLGVWLLVGCGGKGVEPVLYESLIVDKVVTLEPGAFVNYLFYVNPLDMQEPAVVGALVVNSGTTGTIQVLILSDENFELWKNGGIYSAVFESAQTAGGNFEIPIRAVGSYHFILSNKVDPTAQKSVDVTASVHFFVYPE